MNNELKEYIENRVNEFKENLINEIEDKIEKENKSIWDLDISKPEEYFATSSNCGIYKHLFNSNHDEKVRESGNAFLTREEAEFELERRKIETFMRKHSTNFKQGEKNYFIGYDVRLDVIRIFRNPDTKYAFPYFESEEVALKVIDEIGEERLKKYWFRAEE